MPRRSKVQAGPGQVLIKQRTQAMMKERLSRATAKHNKPLESKIDVRDLDDVMEQAELAGQVFSAENPLADLLVKPYASEESLNLRDYLKLMLLISLTFCYFLFCFLRHLNTWRIWYVVLFVQHFRSASFRPSLTGHVNCVGAGRLMRTLSKLQGKNVVLRRHCMHQALPFQGGVFLSLRPCNSCYNWIDFLGSTCTLSY